MFDIFDNISIEFKEIIEKKMNTDYNFKNYVNNCNRLNINIFERNNISKLEDIIKNLKLSKINNFKNLKNNLENEEYIEKNNLERIINKYYKKIDMLENLKKYTELKYNFGIIEIIEFDKNLFLLSEDNYETNKKIFYIENYSNNEIIQEYSNCK